MEQQKRKRGRPQGSKSRPKEPRGEGYLLKLKEVAHLLNCTTKRVSEGIEAGTLPKGIVLGKRQVWSKKMILDYIEKITLAEVSRQAQAREEGFGHA